MRRNLQIKQSLDSKERKCNLRILLCSLWLCTTRPLITVISHPTPCKVNRVKRSLLFFEQSKMLGRRHEICQTFYTTGFSGRKFYTLKVHALRLFLLTIKQCKCINIRNLGPKCVKIQRFKSKITLGVCKFCLSKQIMQEKMLFS